MLAKRPSKRQTREATDTERGAMQSTGRLTLYNTK